VAEIARLAQALVRIPSQAEFDDPEIICRFVEAWLLDRQIDAIRVCDPSGRPLGIYGRKQFTAGGPCLCLNACLDTAPVGSREPWQDGPFSGAIVQDWLHGRGAADSKIGAALFCELFSAISACQDLKGTLYIYLDLDEHRGVFSGIHTFIKQAHPCPDFIFIAYPGSDKIRAGARGIYRVNLTIHGIAAHTGATRPAGENAVEKSARFISLLSAMKELPDTFGPGPKVSVTTIHGGSSFSIVPDTCVLGIDCRLTPTYDEIWAHGLLLSTLDQSRIAENDTAIEVVSSFPAYSSLDHGYVSVLRNQAQTVMGKQIPVAVAGPANIGNALGLLGIASTCGFGVTAESVHGANERAFLGDVANVFSVYRETILHILAGR
jgi:succinyl-diaminopimelate desuccinylase